MKTKGRSRRECREEFDKCRVPCPQVLNCNFQHADVWCIICHFLSLCVSVLIVAQLLDALCVLFQSPVATDGAEI